VREVFAGLGIAMHLMIWTTMEVGPFSPLSLAFYVTLVHPWEWRRLAAISRRPRWPDGPGHSTR
jgi:hypothetical protein